MGISFACSSPPSIVPPSLSLSLALSHSLALPISGIDPKVFAPTRQKAEPSEAEPSRAKTVGRTDSCVK